MTSQSKNDDDEQRDEEAFNDLLGKMMNTPPKPHDQMKKGREPKPAPKEAK